MDESRADRFTWKKWDINLIGPDQLQCKDCWFQTDRTSKCEQFSQVKPKMVLERIGDCPEYKIIN